MAAFNLFAFDATRRLQLAAVSPAVAATVSAGLLVANSVAPDLAGPAS